MENDTIRGFIYLVVATLATIAIAIAAAISLTRRQEVVDEEAVSQRILPVAQVSIAAASGGAARHCGRRILFSRAHADG